VIHVLNIVILILPPPHVWCEMMVKFGCLQWNVAASTLEIMHKLLSDHEVKVEDFVDVPCVDFVQPSSAAPAVMSKPPGHTILVHLTSDSATLKTVRYSGIGNFFIYVIIFAKYNRVATKLENLEYSGISLNIENSGNSVQPQGKIVTNKIFLVRHSNICVKQLLTG